MSHWGEGETNSLVPRVVELATDRKSKTWWTQKKAVQSGGWGRILKKKIIVDTQLLLN